MGYGKQPAAIGQVVTLADAVDPSQQLRVTPDGGITSPQLQELILQHATIIKLLAQLITLNGGVPDSDANQT